MSWVFALLELPTIACGRQKKCRCWGVLEARGEVNLVALGLTAQALPASHGNRSHRLNKPDVKSDREQECLHKQPLRFLILD